MTSPQRITEVFQAALKREPDERASFLAQACDGDESLRKTVEALLAAHDASSDGGLRTTVISKEMQRGQEFAHYRIISLLGRGGMGEVYLAQDTRLDRKAAIKVLPADLVSDHSQVGRFQQEARAASALNHPNIVTIYEINEADGRHYIASEYIEGHTLRDQIGQSISLEDALEIVSQVASALAAAHNAGVVHRDIKPENVMLRPDGLVKVLDFGIAKLTERQSSTDDEAPTRALVQTGKGVVMGTAHYMSPEQARGQTVDARTDIWSLGVVLYELVTGKAPFHGDTVSDCIASILKSEPVASSADIPIRLEWVIQKALRKDRDERYQTAKEFLSDLRTVKQEAENSRELQPAKTEGKATNVTGLTQAATIEPQHTTSSAEYIVSEIKRHRVGALVVAGIFAVLIAGGAYGTYKYINHEKPDRLFFQNVEVTRITTNGRANSATISPDGRYVVYVEDEGQGSSKIILNQLATGNTLQIVPPTNAAIFGTVFSPDSNFVYYVMNDLSSEVSSLYQVPAIGGSSRKVLTDLDSPPSFSPDGKQIAFIREENNINFDLVIANLDGTGERVLTTRRGLDWFEEAGPAWSPDGRTIACAAGNASELKGGDIVLLLVGVDVATGAVRELSPKRWRAGMGRVVWMPDGSSLILVGVENVTNDSYQLWRVSQPSGQATRITNDVQARGAGSLSITSDGKTLLSSITQAMTRIETLPVEEMAGKERSLTKVNVNTEGLTGIAWTPDGRIVFSSFDGGQWDLWIMNGDGSNRVRLTSDKFYDVEPCVSPDGRYIVFGSNRGGGGIPHIWRIDIDGSNPLELSKSEDSTPDISPDGRWVIYSSWGVGTEGITAQFLRRVSIDGGTPQDLTDYTAQIATYSPDGNWIALTTFDPTVTPKRWRSAIIPAAGGKPTKQFDRSNYSNQYVRWTTDGKSLSLIATPPVPSNIALQPIDGGPPRTITDFKVDRIYRHAWSKDGRMLAVVRGTGMNDVVLMKDLQ